MAQFTEEEKMLRRIDKRFSKGVVEYGLIEDGDKILIGLSFKDCAHHVSQRVVSLMQSSA